MLNKKLVVIAGASLFFVLLILVIIMLVLQGTKPGKPSDVSPAPLTEPTQAMPQASLKVVSTNPVHAANEIRLSSAVQVSFNRAFTQNEITIEFLNNNLQAVAHDFRINGTKLILTPINPLNQSMIYTVRVRDRYLRIIKEFEFLTLTVEPSPDTRPVTAVTEVVENDRLNNPQIYLANQLPFQSFDFTMVREVDSEGYFIFVVTSNRLSGQLLTDSVNQWLLSIKLSQSQINTFNIQYR